LAQGGRRPALRPARPGGRLVAGPAPGRAARRPQPQATAPHHPPADPGLDRRPPRAHRLVADQHPRGHPRGAPRNPAGRRAGAPGEPWRAVDEGLRVGVRGLSGGSSLARFLAERRGVRNVQSLPRFSEKEILAWADAYHERTGSWPTSASGPIAEAPGETWK